MTCRGDAAATDWLLFGGGRASVRFRPPFFVPRAEQGRGSAVRRSVEQLKEHGPCGAPGRTAKEARAVAALRAGQENMRGPWRHFRPSGRGCGPCGASVSEGGGSEVGKVRKGVAGGSSSGGGEVRVGVTGSRSVGGEVRVGVADGSRSVAGAARIGAVRVGTARIGDAVD